MNSTINRYAWWLALAAAWGWTWRHLSVEWGLNPQYEYGFGIPLLFLYMVWKRWDGRMEPTRSGVILWGWIGAGWLLLLCGEMLRWQDPVWRTTGGLLVLGSTLLTSAYFWRAGGWPLLRRQLFPLLFSWLATPWPTPLENAVTRFLLQLVTEATVGISNLVGIAALQHGNIIELRNAIVGMEDACSGIQSFQATFMVTLFLGEFFRLHFSRRLLLIAVGWVICLTVNLGRILALIQIAHQSGQARMERLHDVVGTVATIINYLLLLGVVYWLSRKTAEPKQRSRGQACLGGRESLAVVLAVVAIPFLVAFWFSKVWPAPASAMEKVRWSMLANNLPAGWKTREVPDTSGMRTVLRYSEGASIEVISPQGLKAKLVHLYWDGSSAIPQSEFVHTPDVCMPSAGWNQKGARSEMKLQIQGQELPFTVYHFSQEGLPSMTVLQLMWSGRTVVELPEVDGSAPRSGRFSALWQAPRVRVTEELLVYFPGIPDSEIPELATYLLDTILQPKRVRSGEK